MRNLLKPSLAIAVSILAIHVSEIQAQQTQTKQEASSATNPVPIRSVVLLSPAKSRISFVGIHVGDDPKPRLGGFKKFQGYIVVDPEKKSIDSITVDIDVDSVWTQFEKLTGHLKNADFFETKKFPNARFVSTKIKMGEKGRCEITGSLTLHGQTSSINFPGQYQFKDGGLLLTGKFKLDRSKFGMNKMLSGVDKMVEVEFSIGQATNPSKEQKGHGGASKKKKSSKDASVKQRQVSVYLPNMT